MSFLVIVGSKGRMAQILATESEKLGIPTKRFGRDPSQREIRDFKTALGVIDFSFPEVTSEILGMAVDAKIPYICGTTGWKSNSVREDVFRFASKEIPIVWDSNFSEGIEVLCQASESLTHFATEFKITDIHHQHKKDSPSGTALKIRDRILGMLPTAQIEIESVREGEVFGIHMVEVKANDENIIFSHSAQSRTPFAAGALRAFSWAKTQKPGFYTMKDILRGSQK